MTSTIHELKAQAAELGLTPDDVRKHGNLTLKATWENAIAATEQAKTNDIAVTVKTWDGEGKLLKTFNDIDGQLVEAPELGKPTDPIGQTESDLSNDITVTVNQPTLYECPQCNGNGGFIDDDSESGWKECDFCDGKKFVTEQACEEYQRWEEEGGAVEMMNQSTEIACLIDHPVLSEGEPIEPADGSIYLGADSRGLPTYWGLFDSDEDKLDIYSLKESDPITPLITIGNVEKKLLSWVSPSATPLRDELTQRMADYVGDCISPQEFEALQNEPLDEYTAAVYLGWLEESKRMLVEALAA